MSAPPGREKSKSDGHCTTRRASVADASAVGPRGPVAASSPRALAEAEAARGRAKTGHRLGLLDGVPISWKDLFDTAGVATEAGSALLSNNFV